jgi:DeoR/GlpR family transcriptional regulator of sugar metabolism
MENPKTLNRLKAVFADAGQTNKWLAEQLGKVPVTVSKWSTEYLTTGLADVSENLETA